MFDGQLTKDRFLPAWDSEIVPAIKSGKRVLIAAHGNTIRGLCQHLDNISDDDITGLDIPTGESTLNREEDIKQMSGGTYQRAYQEHKESMTLVVVHASCTRMRTLLCFIPVKRWRSCGCFVNSCIPHPVAFFHPETAS